MLCADAVRLFLDEREASNCRPATLVYYQTQFRRLLAGRVELPTEPATIRAILNTVKGRQASRHTAFRALRALYLWLVSQELLATNPMAKIRAPRVDDVEQRTLDEADVARLLDVEQSPRDLAIVALLCATGIRSGELRTLLGRDVRGGYIHVTGKTGERAVPVHPDIYALVQKLIRFPSEPVFRTIDDKPISRDRLYQIVRKAFARAGLDGGGKSGPHCLRHSYGRSWVALDGPLPALQKLMGHKNISTTALYTRLSKEEVRQDYEKFSQLTKTVKPSVRLIS